MLRFVITITKKNSNWLKNIIFNKNFSNQNRISHIIFRFCIKRYDSVLLSIYSSQLTLFQEKNYYCSVFISLLIKLSIYVWHTLNICTELQRKYWLILNPFYLMQNKTHQWKSIHGFDFALSADVVYKKERTSCDI